MTVQAAQGSKRAASAGCGRPRHAAEVERTVARSLCRPRPGLGNFDFKASNSVWGKNCVRVDGRGVLKRGRGAPMYDYIIFFSTIFTLFSTPLQP